MVYRGLQKSLGRKVCVKFMQSSLVSSFEWQTRFRREAKALARLQHKHLAQVYSVGFYQNVYPFIVMELLSGVSLRQFIQESGRLEWRTAAEIMIQLCEGMSLVHDKGFVHRDLKPDNVFICQLDGKPCSKILDFGLVGRNKTGVDTETLTGTGDLLGTVLYMAPECFHKAQHNSAVDVYSLGCIFYEMLSGKPPFDGDSPVSIAMKHNSEAIPPLDVEYGSQEEQVYLYSLIAAICDKNPLRRPDCKHIEKSLREALNGNLHQQRRDFQAAELLFGATIGNMSPDLNAKIYQCVLTLDGGGKLKWVRQHRPYVLAELHKILAERTHAQVVDKYLVLASFAELLPDYRLQDNLLSLGALAKPSLGLLLQQYQCKMRLNDRVQARKIEPAIDRELKELVKKSPVEAKDNYTNYATLLAKYGYSIEAMQKLMIAAELCRIHDRLAEENMLLSLISAATFRWWDVKDEIRKDPGYLQVMHRILALPPQDSSTWCRAVTWLEQVDKMAQNEPLAMQCALQIKPIFSVKPQRRPHLVRQGICRLMGSISKQIATTIDTFRMLPSAGRSLRSSGS